MTKLGPMTMDEYWDLVNEFEAYGFVLTISKAIFSHVSYRINMHLLDSGEIYSTVDCSRLANVDTVRNDLMYWVEHYKENIA